MIKEEDRVKLQESTEAEEKAECQEIIKAAAIYERLEANGDWAACMIHLQNLADLHQRQIIGWLERVESTEELVKRQQIFETIMTHQIRRSQIQEAIGYPKAVIQQAIKAREHLQKLREKENQSNAS